MLKGNHSRRIWIGHAMSGVVSLPRQPSEALRLDEHC